MYAIIENGTVVEYPIYDVRQRFAQTSFPEGVPEQSLPEGCVRVADCPQPPFDPITQVASEVSPVRIDGVWRRHWTVTALDAAETAANQLARLVNLQDDIVWQTQHRLDAFAQTRHYDGILSACSYLSSSVGRFSDDALYCLRARDETWAALYAVLAGVQAGTHALPSGFADIEPLLPALQWPG